MVGDRAAIRSYARIFKPDRRVYAIEGHRLPVPGGVPLGWLGWAIGTLVAVLALSGGSWTVAALVALLAASAGLAFADRSTAVIVGVATLGGAQIAGVLLGWLDWPLRLLVVPALVATLATQATPDGRPAHRYVLSWLALQLRPARRSLGRPLPAAGARRSGGTRLAVASDVREWHLDRARVTGPATVRFAAPLLVDDRPGRGRRHRRVIHPPRRLARGRIGAVDRVDLADGEWLELRP